MTAVRALARMLLGWVFVTSGIDVLRNPEPRADTAADLLASSRARIPWLPDDDVAVVRANAVAHVAAGTLLALGKLPRLAAATLAVSLVPTTFAGHRFWAVDDPGPRAQQQIHFNKNAGLLGGLLLLVAAPRRRPPTPS